MGSYTRRAVAVAAASLISVGAFGGTAVAATPVVATATLSTNTITLGQAISVKVTRVVQSAPVTVYWSDGTISTVRTQCTATQAKNTPVKCGKTVSKTYTTGGVYVVSTVQRGAALKGFPVNVTVNTPAPAPEPAPAPAPEPAPAPAPAPAPEQWVTDMLANVNSVRASAGVAPVTLCAPLMRSSQKHSEDMATNNYFSHTSLDGRSPGQRINAEGYIGGWGENIAAGYGDVASVMTGWVNSPGHYANLVNPSFTHIGFGKAYNAGSSYGTYWTQNFGYRGTC